MKKIILPILVLLALTGGFYGWRSYRAMHGGAGAASNILYWHCPMHTNIHSDHPGKCPICSMDMVPKYKVEPTPSPSSRGAVVKDSPEALKGLAPVELDAFKQQTIGVKLTAVSRQPVTRLIRTVGRFAGGGGDFAALAGDFAAQQALRPTGRYVVADVYALDQPFVKAGQKAWVSPFSGSGAKVEAVVTQIYPYDGTQSRITRVRLQLKGPAGNDLYANVEIEATTPPKLSVPREAVLNTGTRDYVFVEEGKGKFIPRPVTVGFRGDDQCEILEGLKEGEKVAWGGTFLLDADAHILAGAEE
jgi:hypothetical protein